MDNKKYKSMDSFSPPPRIKPSLKAQSPAANSARTIPQRTQNRQTISGDPGRPVKHSPRQSSVQEPKRPYKPATKDVNISINLSLPASLIGKSKEIKSFTSKIAEKTKAGTKPHFRDLARHRYFTKAVIGLAVLLVIFGGWQITANILENKRRKKDISQVQTAKVEKPQFSAAIPSANASIQPRYDAERKVISFSDNIGGVPVTISQQQLPENFKTDPQGNVERVAKGFNATEILEAGDTKAFVGKSASGPQSVIFQKNGLMIFIFTNKELPKTLIADYIKTLK